MRFYKKPQFKAELTVDGLHETPINCSVCQLLRHS